MSHFKLLTMPDAQPKGRKGRKKGYLTFILHLAPARLSGYEVCPMRTEGCTLACLNVAGHGGIGAGSLAQIAHGLKSNAVQRARIRRTKLFFEHRADFMRQLYREIIAAINFAKRKHLTPVFRLNGTSDIRWENVPFGAHNNIMQAFPEITFYDYTKIANRRNLPANYSLTFSLAENNETMARQALRNGMNVAAVFRDKKTCVHYLETGYNLNERGFFPPHWYPVFNGDETDLRFLDPKGVIVALYAKGRGKRDTSGFVRD